MTIFDEKIEIRARCKGVHCVDLGDSFPTSLLNDVLQIPQVMQMQHDFRSRRRAAPHTANSRSADRLLCQLAYFSLSKGGT